MTKVRSVVEGGGAEMIDDEIMMLNNKDFFDDDIYDFKETFMRRGDRGANSDSQKIKRETSKGSDAAARNGAKPKSNGLFYDMYDTGDGDGDDQGDYDDDGGGGGVGGGGVGDDDYEEYDNEASKVIYEDEEGIINGQGGYNDDDEMDFRVKTTASDEQRVNSNSFHNHHDDFVDDIDMGMGETFFKRVDSMELVKPKKAKIISNYLIGELLGDGSYGKVKECLDMTTLARRAVKIINLKMVQRKIPHGIENVRKEIRIMSKLDHKNVIKLYGTYEKGSLQPQSNGGAAAPPKTPMMHTVSNNNNNMDSYGGDALLRHAAQLTSLEKPPKLYIFMDYCITSLEKLLKTAPDGRLRNYQACFYFRQLVDGLEYLHSLNIIHNDIKPGNLLITCDDILKICDFSISADLGHFAIDDYLSNQNSGNSQNNLDGLNKSMESRSYNSNSAETETAMTGNGGVNPNLLCGSHTSNKFPISQCTPMFQCPEMLDENMDEVSILREAAKVDIWSSGVTLYQLTTGDLPFKGSTIHQIFELIRNPANPIVIPSFIDQNLKKLLLGMLNRDPVQRFNIKQIRDSDWFKRKHPMIREEMAQLPLDAIQNETSTYRMLNYLEKYCGGDNDLHNVQQQHLQQQQQPGSVIGTSGGEMSQQSIRMAATTNNSNLTQVQQQQIGGADQSEKYGQATKVKRNNCCLM